MALTIQLANNAAGTISPGINNSDDPVTFTLTTGHGARFPTLSGDQYFYVTLKNVSNQIEVLKVTSHAAASDTMTASRMQEAIAGTAATKYTFPDLSIIELRDTAATLSRLYEEAVHSTGYTTTATAAGTTTLTVASDVNQYFTGATTQTVVLPVVSTLVLGWTYRIVNLSTGTVTVQSSGANTVLALAGGAAADFTCILITGTGAASWNATAYALTTGANSFTGVQTFSDTTDSTSGTTGAVKVTGGLGVAKNLVGAQNIVPGYTTTATAAGTTTLTVSSTYAQFFTGSTTQTVVLPVTSTLALGWQYRIVNESTGKVTVQSSGANNILVLDGSSEALFTCILTSGTTAASWEVATVGYKHIPANSQSAAYTTVLSDAGKSIDHPSTDANARTFTIDSNANVPYPVGTTITFTNMTSNVVTIAITSDTLYLAGTGTTGSRSLAQYGVATARKLTSTTWLIAGTGLT